MTQDKDERSNATVRKVSATGEDTAKRASAAPTPGPKDAAEKGKAAPTPSASPRLTRNQYLIGARAASGPHPTGALRPSIDAILEQVMRQEVRQESIEIEIVKRMKLGGATPASANGGGTRDVIVARIEE